MYKYKSSLLILAISVWTVIMSLKHFLVFFVLFFCKYVLYFFIHFISSFFHLFSGMAFVFRNLSRSHIFHDFLEIFCLVIIKAELFDNLFCPLRHIHSLRSLLLS